MKLFLSDQSENFSKHLDQLINKPLMSFDKSKLIRKTSFVHLSGNAQLEEHDLDFIFDYKIFPPHILTFETEWNRQKRNMKIGDTIVQQVKIPPINTFSQKIIFGVRITGIIREKHTLGFTYQTIEGHVEKGESTFIVEQKGLDLIFSIHTFSSPGNLLTYLLGPIFTVPYQTYCTKKALAYVKQQFNQGLT